MKFNDFRLIAGRIESRLQQDTDRLAPIAIKVCRELLRRLLEDGGPIPHGVEGLPVFEVSLNAPAYLIEQIGERVEAPDRIFCLQEPGQDPFQVNLVLPATPAPVDGLVAGTLLGISRVGFEREARSERELLDRIKEILDARPVLATALIPTPENLYLFPLAADFSTCFAAAMLLEFGA